MEPSRQTKELGDEVKFVCKTYNAVKWTLKDIQLPRFSKVSGSMNEILTFKLVKPSYAGPYKCTILDEGEEFSSVGILELNGELI